MDKNKKPTADAALVEPRDRRSGRRPNARMVQNFLLTWLDESIDETNNEDCRNSITNLRQVVNTVNRFTDADACIDCITDNMEEKTFMIVSETFSETIIPIVQDIPQVVSIYIICNNNTRHEQCPKQWSKVKGIFTDIIPICEVLKMAAHDCDQNSVFISFAKTMDEASNKNHDELHSSFMYTQILKEILLAIVFEPVHFEEFLTYCREPFIDNISQLQNVDKFEKEYRHHQSIWWYTHQCFLYTMINRALRTMEIELIVKMGFFVRDLHEDLVQLHSEQYAGNSTSFTVYRGQGLSKTDFDQLKETKGGLMSFNNFLSTSFKREVSFAYAESNSDDPDMIGVLFQITIDPSISTTPFAKVNNVSAYQTEEEILFSMHSVFRIEKMETIDKNVRLWQVDLLLTSDNDTDLRAVTERMRKETFPHLKGWQRLGNLLIHLCQFDKAEQVCEVLLDQTADEREEAGIYHMLGIVKYGQEKYAKAITFYEKAIKINEKILTPHDPNLGLSYDSIGLAYSYMGDYAKALSFYEKALEIYPKCLRSNHPNVATSYRNIGSVYFRMGDYSKALLFYEKDLEICRKNLPRYDPKLANSYNNIGSVYSKMGDYPKALSYDEKALEIYQKILPPNHPNLATFYHNIGMTYSDMGDHPKALSCHEKALEIYQKTLPPNHSNLANYYKSIGHVYWKKGDYAEALSFYEKDLEICQKFLPPDHPELATSYSNIGSVYSKTGDYSKALPYYEKHLEICQKTLPPDHPELATSYSNIGYGYCDMGDYSKALSFYEKAVEIREKSLSPNQSILATYYNKIGSVYSNMGDYSKALSSFERALDIGQRLLPANHPHLRVFKKNIRSVKKKL